MNFSFILILDIIKKKSSVVDIFFMFILKTKVQLFFLSQKRKKNNFLKSCFKFKKYFLNKRKKSGKFYFKPLKKMI